MDNLPDPTEKENNFETTNKGSNFETTNKEINFPMNKKASKIDSLINYIKLAESHEESLIEEESLDSENEVTGISSTSSESSYRRDSSKLFESLKEPSGAWGIHRFEKCPWSDYSRPCVKLEEYGDLSLDEDEKSGLLTDSIISSCLSYLERSPYDLKYVLCKCVLSHKKLTDISALTCYHYIQYLDLSYNDITTLAPLEQLPFLQHLNASHNNIELLLDFKAPFYLGFVNYSYNSIVTIPDLSEFWSINHLDISNNKITKISGLENLRFLNVLNLSYNKITTLENLHDLRIQFLILHHNAVDDTKKNTMNLKALSHLRSVDLSNNNLTSLRIFENAENLENINMFANKIPSLLELYYLENLRYLSKLNLSNNPVSEIKFYINVCLRIMKNLMVLDGNEISAEQRIEIKNNYEIDRKLDAGESHIELILLQQINHPDIGAYIVPYDQPPPMIFVLIGPPGSRKQKMALNICKKIKKCVLGISHTTRPMTDSETDGEDYHFVTSEVFKGLMRRGRFIAVSEFNGYSYGITYEEIQKGEGKILIFHSDINAAFRLRLAGLNPRLILAMPRNGLTHLIFLKRKYMFDEVEQGICRIANSLDYFRVFDSVLSMNDAAKYGKSTVEDIVQKVLDEKYYDELLQENTSDVGHTVTPVPLSEDEIVPDDIENTEDTDPMLDTDPTLCSILKRGPGTKEDGPRVSFFKSPYTRNSAISAKFGSTDSSQSNLSSADKSHSEPSDETNNKNVFDPSTIGRNYRSISKDIIHLLEQSKKLSFVPIFSAISAPTLNRRSSGETVYISPAEIFNLIRDEKLATFFKNVIDSREELLNLHWSNPGLFREVIFTEEEEESLQKMKALIKFSVENYKSMVPTVSVKDDPSYQRTINSRFGQLDFQQYHQCQMNWSEANCFCENPEESHQDV